MQAYNMPAINYELLLFITFLLLQITCVFLTNYQSANVQFYQVYKKNIYLSITPLKKKLLIYLDSLTFINKQ